MAWQDRAYNREDSTGGIPPVQFSFPPLTRLTLTIMVVCTVAFFLVRFVDPIGEIAARYGTLTFAHGVAFTQPWRWVTYQYLHASGTHIFFNLLGLYFFLPTLEQMWGWKRALAFYTAGGVFAGVTYGLMVLAVARMGGGSLVGASGSIFAAMGAVALFFPQRQLILLVFPVPIRIACALFAILFFFTIAGDRNFSDAAHLGGLAFGFCAPWLAGPVVKRYRTDWHRRAAQRQADQARADEELVDRILQKVHDTGMNSLTRWERKALKQATERQRLAEVARARRGF